MMSTLNPAWAALIAILLLIETAASAQADPWERLRYKTAWVPIGLLSQGDNPEWINEPTHRIYSRDTLSARTLPQIGDVIEVANLGLIQLHVLDFGTKGEERRMESPGSVQRQLTREDDVVGAKLPVGTRLFVQDVQLQEFATGTRFVWLRVSPAP